jgi:hypothetical protein
MATLFAFFCPFHMPLYDSPLAMFFRNVHVLVIQMCLCVFSHDFQTLTSTYAFCRHAHINFY